MTNHTHTVLPADLVHVALAALAWARLAAHLLHHTHPVNSIARAEFAVAVTHNREALAAELQDAQEAQDAAQRAGERSISRLDALEAVAVALDCAREALDQHRAEAERLAQEVTCLVLSAWGRAAVESGGAHASDLDALREASRLVARLTVAAAHLLART